MKKGFKMLIAIVLSMTILNLQAIAGSSIITFDSDIEVAENFGEEEIYSEFSEIDDLYVYLEENEGATYSEIESENSSLVENVSSNAAVAMNSASSAQRPPIFGPFLWGCLFSIVGIVVVAVTTDSDRDQIRSSAWGCVVNFLLSGGVWVFGAY